jgi:DNA invertase Pin-like site-specific DNA recombinase
LQLDALRAAGCDKLFIEIISGSRVDRPELANLLEVVREGDTVVCWRLDRIGRSLRHLVEMAERLQQRGVAFRSLTENIDTSTPSGRFLFNILGALSQMEREIIIERTRAGLVAAAARGRRGGRPAALDASKIRAAKAMLASGNMSAIEVAQQLWMCAQHVVSPCAGWTHRRCRERDISRRLMHRRTDQMIAPAAPSVEIARRRSYEPRQGDRDQAHDISQQHGSGLLIQPASSPHDRSDIQLI